MEQKPERQIDPGHTRKRGVLRVLGPVILAIGLIFIAIGTISFFSSFGSFEPPKYFWCAFVGMPLLFVGIVLTQAAFVGAVARYFAQEGAPVGKDTFNYMADGTKDGVKTVATAVGEGIGSGIAAAKSAQARCQKCNHPHDAGAKFCSNCGASMVASKACPGCKELNEADARFCSHCGNAIA